MTTLANQLIASDDLSTAGAISYWRLSGDTKLDELTAEWEAGGLDVKLLPAAPSPRLALTRALRDIEGRVDDNTVIKALNAKNGWWALVSVVADAAGNVSTHQIAKARWDSKEGRLYIEAGSYELEQRIRAGVYAHRDVLATTDISGWLIDLAEKHAAVGLRDSGGIYFVPRGHVSFWQKVATVVEKVAQHKVFRIPALKSDEAVEAIVDAITQDANRAAETLTEALLADGGIGPGTRALATMGAACQEKLDKVRHYEGLLGIKLPEVVAKVQELAAKVARVAEARASGVASAAEALAGPVAAVALIAPSATA